MKSGDTVLVIGSGMAGILHIALARAQAAGRIIATDISDYRVKAASQFGADFAVHSSEDVPAMVREANDGRLADLVIVCTGAPSAFIQALNSVDRGGTILFFSTTPAGHALPVPIADIWRNGIRMMPSYGAGPLDLVVAMELIRAGRVSVKSMISHQLPLEETALGFQLVANAQESMKVIIQPHN